MVICVKNSVKMNHFMCLLAFGLLFFSTTCLCDTIHFTNSQNHLQNSTSFKRYDLKLPDLNQSIALIEADTPNVTEQLSDRIFVARDRLITANQNIVNLPQRNDFNSRLLELTTSPPSLLSSSGTTSKLTDAKIITKESVSHGIFLPQSSTQTKKTVYSPDLLKKFLKDYNEKLRTEEEEETSDEVSDISNTKTQNADRRYDEDVDEDDLIETKLSPSSIEDKLNEIAKLSHQITTRSPNEDESDSYMPEDDFDKEEKYGGQNHDYRNKKYSNRFNDRDGWVTLDAVPWSSSKVSKWQPNPTTQFGHVSSLSMSTSHWPNDDDNSYDNHRPQRPPSYNSFPTHDDDYFDNRPGSYPNHHKKPSYSYNNENSMNFPKPSWTNSYDDNDRPSHNYGGRPRPQTDYYSHKPASWYDNKHSSSSYDTQSQKPLYWSDGDIVTDGHPSNFPNKHTSHQRPPPPYQYENNDHHHYQAANYQQHPQSHPSNGNGEWVLISTTKGYHMPQKHGNRAMSYKPGDTTTNPHKTQTIQMNVLPAASSSYETSSSPHSHQALIQSSKKNITTSHDGLIEVEPSLQSMEEIAEVNDKKTTKKQKRRKLIKGVPLSSRDSHQDSSAILAAVGAGMVPATVAMLMPMVLGRKRRYLVDENDTEQFDFMESSHKALLKSMPRGVTM